MRIKFTQVLCVELICFWSDIIYDFITGAGKKREEEKKEAGNEIKFSTPPLLQKMEKFRFLLQRR